MHHIPKIAFLLLAVYFAVNFYIYLHGRWALPPTRWVQAVYLSAFAVCACAMFIGMATRNILPWQAQAAFGMTGGYWMFLLVYFLLCCVIVDLVRIAEHFTGFLPMLIKNNYAATKLAVLGVVLLGTICMMIVGYGRFTCPQIVTFSVDVPKKESMLDAMKIVVISDIHLGGVVQRYHLQKYVQEINALDADLVLIAGDLVDNSLKPVKAQHLEEELRQIRSKYGVYASLGNHDYFDSEQGIIDFMRSSNIVPLCDTSVAVANAVILAGRHDYSQKHRKPLQDIINSDMPLPVIVLDHQPRNPQQAAQHGASLQLMGHTHGGQIFPFTLVVKRMYGNFVYGYQRLGSTHYYTSSGIAGWGAPMRTGTRSEIVCINVKFVK